MKIVLATGIYPPDIGGPATYVRRLAEELNKRGEDVTVVTYGSENEEWKMENEWKIIRVSKFGGPLLRWRRYSKALKKHGGDADIVECFSSVSCGVPVKMAKLKKPRKILRLGGDFAWERYTDLGRRRTLRDFIAKHPKLRLPTKRLLRIFDHVVFSTRFQKELYDLAYDALQPHSVIENALPHAALQKHLKHDILRLLYFGRFVKFKNLENLLRAVAGVPLATLTLVGEGPEGPRLGALARSLQLHGRVSVVPPVHGEHARKIFGEHDLLALPSLTEISPNSALEARASGLPVLLTAENGLSEELRDGMIIRPLITVADITKAILEADQRYEEFAEAASAPIPLEREWKKVAEEHLTLFQSLLQ
ncbi:glycosyltransferase family 4 protein [Candidatus Peregrinibacteria bacterium]|nr:glycosyltransferase family 4 protein [Candidatus Peregrinibacteria bacterium]